ncbi:hypothetical protein [Muricoccus pecuniae]|uniref:Uncharacterized protein n=1 Tax=Muricoccus pecuniae TaxID=693023 RepID=A0A840YAZ8_9PROT|nr:hypothetical protein [Roseomonas pecuniae]MBB5693231.1 hypothetical protein [Roseomonas pecuniae]
MLRSLTIALGAVVALAAAHPNEASAAREARSSGKAAHPAAAARAPVAVLSRSSAAAAPRAAGRATIRTAARGAEEAMMARGSRAQARVAGRRQAELSTARPGLRMVSLFSAPAAAAVPMGGGKSAKAPRGEGRMGVWHAGLPAPDGEQMDCPTGTMAVLARGHADTFRCMPM